MMTALKSLTILAALVVGGISLAIAQSGPPTGGQPPVAGGAAGNPAAPGPGFLRSAAPPAQTAAVKHHKKMYMSTKHRKHSS
jgi:hypothetical protein